MTDEPLSKVVQKIEKLIDATHNMGGVLDDPFMQLSFLALPVVPEIKITDRGLFDVGKFDYVPLYVE
jgi:adenine deaminase